MQITRKQIKANRSWKHWLYWLEPEPWGEDGQRIKNYDPEKYREAFNYFQSNGRRGLTDDQVTGIYPLIQAQKAKEITLNMMVEESMYFWSDGGGWRTPWRCTLDLNKTDTKKFDRLTLVAILRIMRSIDADPLDFFARTTSISPQIKIKYYERLLTRPRE